MAEKGDVEAEIYVDGHFGYMAMQEPKKYNLAHTMQALERASEKGCPVSQFRLGRYLLSKNDRDEVAISLFKSAAKYGLIVAHWELGLASVLIYREILSMLRQPQTFISMDREGCIWG
jgi:TPR repeat protein